MPTGFRCGTLSWHVLHGVPSDRLNSGSALAISGIESSVIQASDSATIGATVRGRTRGSLLTGRTRSRSHRRAAHLPRPAYPRRGGTCPDVVTRERRLMWVAFAGV